MSTNHPTNDHKPPANNYKPPANNHKPSANNNKPPANNHTCISYQNVDVSFLLPAHSNYENHLDFKKHMQQKKGHCLNILAEKAKLLAFVGLVASISAINRKNELFF